MIIIEIFVRGCALPSPDGSKSDRRLIIAIARHNTQYCSQLLFLADRPGPHSLKKIYDDAQKCQSAIPSGDHPG